MQYIDKLEKSPSILQNRIQGVKRFGPKAHPTFEQVDPKWEHVETQSIQQHVRDQSIDPYVELKRACLEMESIFIKIMFDAMKKTVHKEEFLGRNSLSQDVFEDMSMVHRARNTSYTQSMGIAKSMYEQNVSSIVSGKK